MIRRAATALLIALAAPTTPALATGEISCSGEGVSVDLLVGRLPVLGVVRAVITVGTKTWSSDPSVVPGTPIGVGQGFEDDRTLVVDFTDDNIEDVIGRLRAFALEEGDHFVSGGVFSLKGEGAWIVDCSLRG